MFILHNIEVLVILIALPGLILLVLKLSQALKMSWEALSHVKSYCSCWR